MKQHVYVCISVYMSVCSRMLGAVCW